MRYPVVSLVALHAAGALLLGCGEEKSSAPPTDETPPTVQLTAPLGGLVSGTVTVTANAADNEAVRGVQFMIDDDVLGAEDTSAPYAFEWNTAMGPNVAHRIWAIAEDMEGNPSESNRVTVTVNNATTGTIEVTLVTDGADLDGDGYVVTIGGLNSNVPANGGTTIEGTPLGDVAVKLTGLADNCAVIGYSIVRVGVIPSVLARLAYRVHCESLTAPTARIVWRHQSPVDAPDFALFSINGDGSGRQLFKQGDNLDPEWTSDHSRLLFGDYDVAVPGIFAKAASGTLEQILSGNAVSDASWAPAGGSTVWVFRRAGTDVLLANAPGTSSFVEEGSKPAWAPSLDSILFVRAGNIWIGSPTSGGLHQVIANGSSPRWSPNGSKVLFWRDMGGGVGSYWIMNADGTEATMIIQGAHIPDAGSSWSPNGRQFVYSSNAGGQSNLWIVNIDGTGDRNLTGGTGETNIQPTWFR